MECLTSAFVGGPWLGKPITHRSGIWLPTISDLSADLALHLTHPFFKPQHKTILQLFPKEAKKLFNLMPCVKSHVVTGLGSYP